MTRILCDEQLLFRPAVPADAPRIQTIIRQAQAQMRAAGSLQWQNGYPGPEHIAADLLRGYGRVLCRPAASGDAEAVAYGAVSFDGEPAYGAIEGGWSSDDAYVVLHRLAVADEAKRQGVATAFFHRTEELARARGVWFFSVDTNFDNHYMLHLLEREGFAYRGKICYDSGERLAFEKALR